MGKRYITDKQIHHRRTGYCITNVRRRLASRLHCWCNTEAVFIPVLMSHYTGIKMHTLDVRLRDGDTQEHNAWMADHAQCGTNILVLDDINDTGETFAWIKQDWGLDNIADDIKNVRFATIIDNVPSKFDVDYSSIEINKAEDPAWIVFPFEEWW